MPQVIAYDILRLFIGPASLTPRGIDRVDSALAHHIFSDPDVPHVGILPTPFGTFAMSAAQVARLISYLDLLWREAPSASDDGQLAELLAALVGPAKPNVQQPIRTQSTPLSRRQLASRMLHMLATTGCLPRHRAVNTVPVGAHYLNIGQLGLAMPGFFKWLDKRPDIFTAMMVHDAIPLAYPHLVPATSPNHHAQMITTAAERADCMIYNSHHTLETVSDVMIRSGLSTPPGLVRALPLPSAFFQVETSFVAWAEIPYFVTVSTVEPRKNHELLLRVWRSLISKLGDQAPYLLIIGSPGHDAARILAPLSNDPLVGRKVHHVAGLSSATVAALLLGAIGVLCPSLAEGFGLPLLEAEAYNIPAIASDIPSHREIPNGSTVLLPADADDLWEAAITTLLNKAHHIRKPRSRPPISYRMTEAAYCADVLHYLDQMSATGRPKLQKTVEKRAIS